MEQRKRAQQGCGCSLPHWSPGAKRVHRSGPQSGVVWGTWRGERPTSPSRWLLAGREQFPREWGGGGNSAANLTAVGGMGTSAQFSKWWGREVCSAATITGKDGQFHSAGIWGPRGNDGDPYVAGGGETRTASWAQIMTPASRGMGLKHPQ